MFVTKNGRMVKESLVNEKFPEPLPVGKRIARAPSFSTTRLDQIVAPTATDTTTTTDNNHLDIPSEQSARRHSWSSTFSDFSRFGEITLSVTDFSYSRCSSVSNIHDLMEESFSDDETNEHLIEAQKKTCTEKSERLPTKDKCSTTISTPPKSPILPQKSYLSFPASSVVPTSPQLHRNRPGSFGGPRRSSWTAGDRNDHLNIFRQSSMGSARGSIGSMDLPAISEPSSGESTSSEDGGDGSEGMEHSVKIEVEKLLRFSNRRGTLGCDGDIKEFGDRMNVKAME